LLSDKEIRHLLLLHRLAGEHPRSVWKLLKWFGSAERALQGADAACLEELGVPGRIASRVSGWRSADYRRAVERDLRWLEAPSHHLVYPDLPDFPARLKEIHDPPPLLFADGDVQLLASLQIAMVGSRKMSATGRKVAMMLAGDLSRCGLTITSGLAIGVDAASHEGALAADGPTIAVLGSGCDVIYPPRHRRLADRVRTRGLIVSEFPLGTEARPHHFPQRNRVVTGMSLGTLVVEAALKSGSLISARLAMEQGREVFAVPGSVLNPSSRGCHKLIREGAKLTETAHDVVEELAGIVEPVALTRIPMVQLSPAQHGLLSLLGSEPVSVDFLTESSGLGVAEVLSMLIELEIDGVVQMEPGGYTLTAAWAGYGSSADA
jgi:DNA processing protein